MWHFLILFGAIFFSALFINMKISTLVSCVLYKTEETEKSAKIQLLIMTLAIFFISLYCTLY